MSAHNKSALQHPFYARLMLPTLPRVEADFAACTIIAKNYLGMARIVAESFQAHNPGCPFFVLLMDPVEGYFDPSGEPFHLLEARQLSLRNLPGLLFKYNVLEASTAVKPAFLNMLLTTHDIKKLVYLDPDILILSPLSELSRMLDQHSIVLTPHITRPYPDDAKPCDHDILAAGSFNLGFLGLQRTPATMELLRWWQDKLYHHGLIAFERNMFVDQRWMDLAPGLFEGVAVLREPGYNVAYWNLHERHITTQGDAVFANGRPCYFFHFSGFSPENPSSISKHQDRFKMSDLGDARSLFAKYKQLLSAHGWNETRNWPYTYNFFDNGWRIPDSARRFYWALGTDTEALGDPFTWMQSAEQPSNAPQSLPKPGAELPFGVNLIGYVTSEKGVGEAARSNIRIIKSTNIPYVTNSFVDTGSLNLEAPPENFSTANPYRINLININADQMPYFVQRTNGYLRGRYNIGYWAWELATFPWEWCGSFTYLQEVWVPSQFTRDSVAVVSPLPVICVPHSIDPDLVPDPAWTRERLQIPADVFVYLFCFDFHSFVERKNPVGLIRAFQQAFGESKDVLLLIKSVHADSDPGALRRLQAECRNGNVRIFDQVLSRQAVHSLMQLSDCYVSLHRSEGFGLTLSEAMLCGKPVIATGYSGNLDFMTQQNSFLVPCKLIEIDAHHGPYRKGALWADPDLDSASQLMRQVFTDRRRAAETAARGRTDVLAQLHPHVIGENVIKHLNSLPESLQFGVSS